MRKLGLATAAAMITSPLLALPASAGTCTTGSVASYIALGAGGCSVDGVTIYDVHVSTLGNVSLGNFTPFINSTNTEFGLALNYTANASPTQNADVNWTYNVSGNLLTDAYAAFTGTVTGTGSDVLSETLSNGTTIQLTSPGATTVTFAPIGSLSVVKDQEDFTGTEGTANTSGMINGFSLTATPIPGTLPLFGGGLAGIWAWSRKRKKGEVKALGPAAA